MTTLNERGDALLRQVWGDIQRMNQQRELGAIRSAAGREEGRTHEG